MKDFRELAEEIVQKYFDLPVMGRDGNDVQDLMDRVANELSRQYERGVKDGYEKGFREAKQYGEVYEQELKKIGWNEAVEACEKVAEKIKVHPLNGFGACEEIAESIGKLRRE